MAWPPSARPLALSLTRYSLYSCPLQGPNTLAFCMGHRHGSPLLTHVFFFTTTSAPNGTNGGGRIARSRSCCRNPSSPAWRTANGQKRSAAFETLRIVAAPWLFLSSGPVLPRRGSQAWSSTPRNSRGLSVWTDHRHLKSHQLAIDIAHGLQHRNGEHLHRDGLTFRSSLPERPHQNPSGPSSHSSLRTPHLRQQPHPWPEGTCLASTAHGLTAGTCATLLIAMQSAATKPGDHSATFLQTKLEAFLQLLRPLALPLVCPQPMQLQYIWDRCQRRRSASRGLALLDPPSQCPIRAASSPFPSQATLEGRCWRSALALRSPLLWVLRLLQHQLRVLISSPRSNHAPSRVDEMVDPSGKN